MTASTDPAEAVTAAVAASARVWNELVREQQNALLALYGLTEHHCREERGAMQGTFYVASVGFLGEEVSGFALVVMDEPAAQAAQRHQGIPEANWQHDDFTGECCNMFAGKIKAALISRGVRMRIATPAVLRVGNLLLPPPVNAFSVCRVILADQGVMGFQAELHTPEKLDLTASPPDASGVSVAEGTSLFL